MKNNLDEKDRDAIALMDRVVAAMTEGNKCPTHATAHIAIEAACMLLLVAVGLRQDEAAAQIDRLVSAAKTGLVAELDAILLERDNGGDNGLAN